MRFHIPNRVKGAAKVLLGRAQVSQSPKATFTNHKEYVFPQQRGIRLAGKVAVVSGGSGAIGRAICACMLAEGAVVYVGGRSKDKIEAVAGELRAAAHTDKAKALLFQITEEESVKEAVSQVVAESGRLDIWVNCAGGSAREKARAIHEQDLSVIEEDLSSNLRACIIGSKNAASQMVSQKGGRIINISSVIGIQGKRNFSDYAAAKAGIIGFTRSMALEVGPHGVTMNCISPGFIQRGDFNESALDYLVHSNCLETVGACEDIANAVVFMASDEAKFVTGQNLMVDGGRSLGLRGDS